VDETDIREVVRGLLTDGRPGSAWDAMVGAYTDMDPAAARWTRETLAPAVAGSLPSPCWSSRRLQQARAWMGRTWSPRARPGEVGVAALPVARLGGGAMCRLRATRGPHGDAQLGPQARAAVATACQAAFRHFHTAPFDVSVSVDGPVDGDSIGLAAALAICSLITDRPLPDDVCASGALDPAGAVQPVGEIGSKAAGVDREWPHGRLLVPARQRAEFDGLLVAEPVATLGEAVDRVWGDAVPRVDDAIETVRRLAYEGRPEEAAVLARRLLGGGRGLARGEILWLWAQILASANHVAHDREAAEAREAIAALTADRDDLDVVQVAETICHEAIDRLDATLECDDRELVELLATFGRRDSGARSVVQATRARLAAARGDGAAAVDLAREALATAPADEKARCGVDLAAWLAQAGEVEEAMRALDEADQALAILDRERGRRAYADRTRRFWRLARARCLRLLGRRDEALGEIEAGFPGEGIDPGLRLELERARLLPSTEARAMIETAEGRLPTWARERAVVCWLLARARLAVDIDRGADVLPALEALMALPGLAHDPRIAAARAGDSDALHRLVETGPY